MWPGSGEEVPEHKLFFRENVSGSTGMGSVIGSRPQDIYR